jgi:hypothetical protein
MVMVPATVAVPVECTTKMPPVVPFQAGAVRVAVAPTDRLKYSGTSTTWAPGFVYVCTSGLDVARDVALATKATVAVSQTPAPVPCDWWMRTRLPTPKPVELVTVSVVLPAVPEATLAVASIVVVPALATKLLETELQALAAHAEPAPHETPALPTPPVPQPAVAPQ